MKRNKNNIIFHTNSILLSAFSDNNNLKEKLINENNSIKSIIDKNLSDIYDNVLKNNGDNYFSKSGTGEYEYRYYIQVQFLLALAESLKTDSKNISTIKNICRILSALKAADIAIKHFEQDLLINENNDREITEILADLYCMAGGKYYAKSISMQEKLIKNYKIKKTEYYYRLAITYERVYQDKEIDKQIEYALTASKMSPNNNLINIFLAKLYYRKGLKLESDKYCQMVMRNNPTPEQIVSASRFLMQDGRLKESYDMYRCRFLTNNVSYPESLKEDKRWDGKKDLSNSTVIIHYEQGFGDTIMFCRYVPIIASMAKKVILVVQKSIIPVLKSSGFDKYCEILSHEADIGTNIKLDNMNASVMYSKGSGMSKIPHDYHIPMLDLPYLIGETPERMKEAKGYFLADKDKSNEFKNKFIKNDNHLKIGIAYRGSKESEVTYRDVTINEFLPLLNLKNVDLYLFQADLKDDELDGIDTTRIFNISNYLTDFGNTAAAINNMDLIISTDNVVMNLAGALAVKTYALFNIYPESRWYKTIGKDIGWYKSVRPFQVKTFNSWDYVMQSVQKQIQSDFKNIVS